MNKIFIIKLIIFTIFFFSCNKKEKQKSTEYKKSVQYNNNKLIEIKNDEENKINLSNVFLFGKNKELALPLVFNENGDRFNVEYRSTEMNSETSRNLKKILNISNSEEYFQNGYSYGYVRLNENVIAEFFGFGWNDFGEIDDVNYNIYILIHDTKGKIFDSKQICQALNINNLIFSSFKMVDTNFFIVYDYKFVKNTTNEFGEENVPKQILIESFRYDIDLSTGNISNGEKIEEINKTVNVTTNIFDGF